MAQSARVCEGVPLKLAPHAVFTLHVLNLADQRAPRGGSRPAAAARRYKSQHLALRRTYIILLQRSLFFSPPPPYASSDVL